MFIFGWYCIGDIDMENGLGGGIWSLNGIKWFWGIEEDWFINLRLKLV